MSFKCKQIFKEIRYGINCMTIVSGGKNAFNCWESDTTFNVFST